MIWKCNRVFRCTKCFPSLIHTDIDINPKLSFWKPLPMKEFFIITMKLFFSLSIKMFWFWVYLLCYTHWKLIRWRFFMPFSVFLFSLQYALKRGSNPMKIFKIVLGARIIQTLWLRSQTYLFFFICCIDYCASINFCIFSLDSGIKWTAGWKCCWGWLIHYGQTHWKFFWQSWQVNLASESQLGYFLPNQADSKFLCWLFFLLLYVVFVGLRSELNYILQFILFIFISLKKFLTCQYV